MAFHEETAVSHLLSAHTERVGGEVGCVCKKYSFIVTESRGIVSEERKSEESKAPRKLQMKLSGVLFAYTPVVFEAQNDSRNSRG